MDFLIKKLITLAAPDEEDGLEELSEYMTEADAQLAKARELYKAGTSGDDQEWYDKHSTFYSTYQFDPNNLSSDSLKNLSLKQPEPDFDTTREQEEIFPWDEDEDSYQQPGPPTRHVDQPLQ